MSRIRTTTHEDILIAHMDDGRANTLGDAMLQALGNLLDEAVRHKALVLTGSDRFFSAGLDLPEVSQLDEPALQAFVWRLDDTYLRLMTLPIPTVAAINGHAIAGGLLLAFSCDTRLAAEGEYKVGINELNLGIPLPMVALEVARRAIPDRRFFQVVAQGMLTDPTTAEEMGLVQQLTSTLMEDALETARNLAQSPQAYASLKQHLLAPHLERIEQDREEVTGDFVTAWFTPDARAKRKAALTKLGSR